MRASVSVVVTNYNAGRFLAQGVESVLGQEVEALEILVVDDGSSDDSFSRLRPYLDRVEWTALAHGGQAAALNAALARCRGDWVAFLESDDLWLPGKLKTVLGVLAANPGLAVVQHSMSQVDAGLKPLPTRLSPASRRQTMEDFLQGHCLLTGLSALIVRREILEELLPLPEDLLTCVDEYLQPRLLARGPIEHLARPLGLRRVHGLNFYAGIRRDPQRLQAYLGLRAVLDRHLEAFLKEKGFALKPDEARRRRAQALEFELLSLRFQGAWGAALGVWRDILRLIGLRPYVVFKAFVLALALAWPAAYFGLSRIYEGRAWLPRLREKFLS